jgi:hypothetical protein
MNEGPKGSRSHADGYSGFNELYRSGGISEVACLAHARRKFTEVFQSEGLVVAGTERIVRLYGVGKEVRGRRPDAPVRLDQTHARPILDDLKAWLHAQPPKCESDP